MRASPLEIALRNGRKLPVSLGSCGHCFNEWYYSAQSPEWTPNFCPYCGIRFKWKTQTVIDLDEKGRGITGPEEIHS
jgi:hypothetical protein